MMNTSTAFETDKRAGPSLFRRRAVAGPVCAVLIGIFHVATIRTGHEWADDFSMYVLHARNIVNGASYAETGYIYNPQNPNIGPRSYPPGFPLLLTPAVQLFGLDLRPMKVVVIACLIASLLLLIPVFRRVLLPAELAALVLVVGLNPLFWELKDHVLSDVPFLAFTLASLHLFVRSDEANAQRHGAALAALSGAAGYAAYATRVLGIALVPCFLAHDLVQHRRIRMNTALAIAVLIGLAGVQYVLWSNDGSYLDQVTSPFAAAQRNVPDYLRSLADLWENGYSDTVRKGAFLAAAALATVGFVTSVRTGPSVLHIFPWVYLGPVILWPAFQGLRFLIPIVPFYFAYCFLGVRWIGGALERRGATRNIVFAVFLAAVTLSYGARYSTLSFGRLPHGVATEEGITLFEFVKASTGAGDVFLFSRPRALALFTGRRASAPFGPADPCALWRYIGEIGASYVVTGPESDPFNSDAVYLRGFVSRFRNDFTQLMANRDVAVYRIERNPCTSDVGRTMSNRKLEVPQ
jgi:4-amino-4-deoxy-L-arabinose transferase-like glycosyltransferase